MYENDVDVNYELNERKTKSIKMRAYLMEKDNLRNPISENKMIDRMMKLVEEVANAYQED